ncbi:MAG: hypothetical protein HQK72_08735 [Desulfamplus sp.]|nr:hypothetical protein [Desulfamplus sp.]
MAQIGDKNILDRKFLEFWGNLFLNVAKGQEQIEQLSSLMNMDSITNMDFMNFKDMAKMFKQSYGLPLDDSDKIQKNSPNMFQMNSGNLVNRVYKPKDQKSDEIETIKLRESFEAFQSSFAKYIAIWGWIPKTEHEELKKSYDTLKGDYETLKKENKELKQNYNRLKQKADVQEELISQLRDILNAKGMGHIELFQHVQNLARKQTGEFQNLIQNLQNLFKIGKND